MSHPVYSGKSPDDNQTLVKQGRTGSRRTNKTLSAGRVIARGCTGGIDTDDSDNGVADENVVDDDNGTHRDWRHSTFAEDRRRGDADSADLTYEEPVGVYHLTPDNNKGKIAMEDSMTGSFTNSGYDSDSESDMSPVIIRDRMAEALTKRQSSTDGKGYNRQLSTPSPDRSPHAVKRIMEAPFRLSGHDSGSDSSDIPESTSLLEQTSPEQSPSLLKKFQSRFFRRKSIPSPNRSPLTIRHQMTEPFDDVNCNHGNEVTISNTNDTAINNIDDVNRNNTGGDSDIPQEEPPSPEVSLLTLKHQMKAGPFASHSKGDLTTENTYLSQTDNTMGHCNQNSANNIANQTTNANNNPGDIDINNRVIPFDNTCIRNTSNISHAKSEDSLTETAQDTSRFISQSNTLGRHQPTTVVDNQCTLPQHEQSVCTQAVPCGRNCVHHNTSLQLPKPASNQNHKTLTNHITLQPVAHTVTPQCTRTGCSVAVPCGRNCMHKRQASGSQVDQTRPDAAVKPKSKECGGTTCSVIVPCGKNCMHRRQASGSHVSHKIPNTVMPPAGPQCRGATCSVTVPCGSNCRYTAPKVPMTLIRVRPASPARGHQDTPRNTMCKGKKCSRRAPCGRNCVHTTMAEQANTLCTRKGCSVAVPCGKNCTHRRQKSRSQVDQKMIDANAPHVTSKTGAQASTRSNTMAVQHGTHNSHDTLLPTKGKVRVLTKGETGYRHGQVTTKPAQTKIMMVPAPSEEDLTGEGVQLPSKRKGGWVKRGKK